MNLERDSDAVTCPKCGRKNYPEVGMSVCDCYWELGRAEKSPCTFAQDYSHKMSDRGTYSEDLVSMDFAMLEQRVAASSTPFAMEYAFIQHQTEKAVLFGVQDGNGLRNQWVPKSVILGIDDANKRVTIASWFKSRITSC